MRTIEGEPSTEPLFERLFGAAEHAFWLDSADAPTRLGAVLVSGDEQRSGRAACSNTTSRRGR